MNESGGIIPGWLNLSPNKSRTRPQLKIMADGLGKGGKGGGGKKRFRREGRGDISPKRHSDLHFTLWVVFQQIPALPFCLCTWGKLGHSRLGREGRQDAISSHYAAALVVE